jgi:RNA polymerase sigma factor (sigma-70 family)
VRELTEPSVAPRQGVLTFEAFFAEHQADLVVALWLVTRNRHEAEEVAQDAFLKLLERWDRVSKLDDPAGYLYRTAMNVHRSRLRRAAAALRRMVHLLPRDDELELVESKEAVVRALAPLSPRQRAAVVLMDVLGLTSEEAGRAMAVKASTVRVLVARGRETLRKEMGADG